MRILVALLLLVAGAATALATVALHTLGWGFVLGAVATLVALIAVGPGWWTRLAFGLGWATSRSPLTSPGTRCSPWRWRS